MIKALVVLAAVALGLGSAAAAEDKEKADCKLFKKSSDGRWFSTVDSKVGNPKSFIVLKAGHPIDRDASIFGNNISTAIDRLCGGK